MLNAALFTSRSEEWSTPQHLFDKLDRKYHFTLDPCATRDNATCKRFFTKAEDGLKQKWTGRVVMNPPYGREITMWVQKAFEEAQQNAELVVCLLPARTDTRWWHDYCLKGEISFIRGRLKFGNANNSAPFPSVIVCFQKRAFEFSGLGKSLAVIGSESKRQRSVRKLCMDYQKKMALFS